MFIDKTRKKIALEENYILEIYKSSNSDNNVLHYAEILINEVNDIYRSIEPNHFKKDFIVCIALNDSAISTKKYTDIKYDRAKLIIDSASSSVTIQVMNQKLLMWSNLNINLLKKTRDVLFYIFKNNKEFFCFNGNLIYIQPNKKSHSIYAPYFYELEDELSNYSIKRIFNSSCELFNNSWADGKRIYFKNKPENEMQLSLSEYLKCTLRNNPKVEREFNLSAKKPVDIRVDWGTANRIALIEIKWLGVSLNEEKNKTMTEYTNRRATDGMRQLKEYLDLAARDAPNAIIKGYLIVIDGRRKGISNRIISVISEGNGYYFEGKELSIPDKYNYSETIYNFEPPIRMFTRPICL